MPSHSQLTVTVLPINSSDRKKGERASITFSHLIYLPYDAGVTGRDERCRVRHKP
jgi:hypothetical protein